MFNLIPPSSSFLISNQLTWNVYKQRNSIDLDSLSSINELELLEDFLQTGDLIQVSQKDHLAIETVLGYQVKIGSFFKVFCKNCNLSLIARETVLSMVSIKSPQGFDLEIDTRFYRLIEPPCKLGRDNLLKLYRLETFND